MLFYLLEHLRYYDDYVKNDHYTNDTIFTHFEKTFYELKGKTWGIIGLGNIGRRVASIANAFGANVIYSSPSGAAPQEGFHQVSLDLLLETADIVSVHAPVSYTHLDVYKRQIRISFLWAEEDNFRIYDFFFRSKYGIIHPRCV